MRICSTYGAPSPVSKEYEFSEIRMDVFQSVPEDCDENTIVTLAGKDVSSVPKGFPGLVDNAEKPIKGFRSIRSFHDFNRTPSSEEIVKMLSDGEQEISKGAFMASSFTDLHSIFLASRNIGRKHVILGMGDTGMVTRIRQELLGNEFTFGYVGKPTAPGQLGAAELRELGDGCKIIGITGDPVTHSKSPQMQDAAMKAAGINGRYLRFGSPDLAHMRDVIIEYNITGMNVTIPHKQEAVEQMDSVSSTVEAVGAMNTIINKDGWLAGENTDVDGITNTFKDIDTSGKTVLIMGSGGAARAAAYAFTEMGCDTYVIGRNRVTVDSICRDLGTEYAFTEKAENYDIVVNCTPIGMYTDGKYPANVTNLQSKQIIFDMVYGSATPLLSAAASKGCRTFDGSDMLVGQGAASFRHWFGKDPDRKVMKEALS
ncbi:MAG: shikimate dehydrogenase [Candidatus Methanomethylophilaceae archaeon]|nr:shikimate dehydrogenase [Candidatus Methanomethylophilaceae archaeon]